MIEGRSAPDGLLSALVIFASLGAAPAFAHGGPYLTGLGTAVVDGVFSAGEWQGAANYSLSVERPPEEGGGTTPGVLYVMNDSQNLYLGLRVDRPNLGNTSLDFTFDNDHDGQTYENGHDVLFQNPTPPSLFYDGVRTNEPPCPPGGNPGQCGFADTNAGGTNDGSGVTTNNGSYSFYEFSHPLDTGDNLHDFSLGPALTVGFEMHFSWCGATDCVRTNIYSGDIAIGASALAVWVTSDRTSYAGNQRLQAAISVLNPTGSSENADFFFGLLLPNGISVISFTDFAFHTQPGTLANLATLVPITSGIPLAAPFALYVPEFLNYAWSPGSASGNYVLYLCAAKAGSLLDNTIDPGDLLSLHTIGFSYHP